MRVFESARKYHAAKYRKVKPVQAGNRFCKLLGLKAPFLKNGRILFFYAFSFTNVFV